MNLFDPNFQFALFSNGFEIGTKMCAFSMDVPKTSHKKVSRPFCTFSNLEAQQYFQNCQNAYSIVEISKAGDVNKTRICTELKNEARCATVCQGTLCAGI
jgi:hypothetical protein